MTPPPSMPPFARRLCLAALAGTAGALAVGFFHICLAFAERHLAGSDRGLVAAAYALAPWRRLLTPALAALAAGFVLWSFSRFRRNGTERFPTEYIEGILVTGGRLDVSGSLVKALASILVVSGGLAVGREGAMILLASLTASKLAQRLAPQEDWPLLTACGAAAGVTAAYHAPLAGMFFALELILGSMAPVALGAAALAAALAQAVTWALGSGGILYALPRELPVAQSLGMYLACLPLAVAAAGFGSVFLRGLDAARDLFRLFCPPVPQPLQLALGGLAVGLLSMGVPEVWGNGYSVIERCLVAGGTDVLPAKLVAVFLLAKLLAMLAGSGAGAPGGFFTPTLFLGATSGTLAAAALAPWFETGAATTTFILTGMTTLLAATTHAPIMAACMVCEITGSYALFPPLLLSAFIASTLARRIRPLSIYGLVKAGKWG